MERTFKMIKVIDNFLDKGDFNEMKETALIKGLTGQDDIPMEYKQKTPFSEINYAKLIIATNNLPTTADKTVGWNRRWCIIDFPNQFSEQKDILEDIPIEEYQCLALKSIAILNRLLKDRKFHNEGDIEERLKRYEERSNPLIKFLDEFTINDNMNLYIPKWEFQKKLNEWLSENKFRTLADKTIGNLMKERGFESDRKYVDWYNNGVLGQKQMRCWVGVGWKDK